MRNDTNTCWSFIKNEFTVLLDRLDREGTMSLSSEDSSRYYARVHEAFANAPQACRSYIFGDQSTGKLYLWLDDRLQQIKQQMGGGELTETTFRKIAHISMLGKVANIVFSYLDAGQNEKAEQRINTHIVKSSLFRDNRARIAEICLEGIATARSAADPVPDVKVVSSVFRLLMVPAGNQGQTTLSAPEITAEYIRSMEVFYNAERVKRLANPQWANEMYARELVWARQCLALTGSTDFPDMYVNMVNVSIDGLKEIAAHPSPPS